MLIDIHGHTVLLLTENDRTMLREQVRECCSG
jgi:hypothetical protein